MAVECSSRRHSVAARHRRHCLSRPFNFEEGKPKGSQPKLHLNPHSWSKVSNIIYLDSPCGVGLSYSINTTKYITGDQQTAVNSHAFLLKNLSKIYFIFLESLMLEFTCLPLHLR
ncbi:hypothetical protein MANES_03G073416v8 [Manihot esculenta]|uniref:Uncharacterized protein n=1 Tax=Manihot esculenta TaxID=3983 RepID=A0ACB7HY78_MANES|nr:hypothetical protein MANES_03G073416v8 [Manihot esculenta]